MLLQYLIRKKSFYLIRLNHHDIHPHFQCLSYGKVGCLSEKNLIPNIPNRTVDTFQVLLQGKCEECLN